MAKAIFSIYNGGCSPKVTEYSCKTQSRAFCHGAIELAPLQNLQSMALGFSDYIYRQALIIKGLDASFVTGLALIPHLPCRGHRSWRFHPPTF